MEVTDSQRIEELLHRVERDPSSIAFAQLAEEYRRVGNYKKAVSVCRGGLAQHPSYVSARVTLGRALMELEQFPEAQAELEVVLHLAPDNLAAIRALAELNQRHSDAGDASYAHDAPLTPPVLAAREETSPAPLAEANDAEFEITIEEREPATKGPKRRTVSALDALVLDLPPAPDFSAFTLDRTWSLPEELTATPQGPQGAPSTPAADPAIGQLQKWLAAIVRDRAHRR